MRLKYKKSTKEIICMGEMPDMTPGPGEEVVDVNAKIPDRLDYFKYDGGLVEKTQQEKDEADNKVKKFDKNKFKQWVNDAPNLDQKVARLAKAVAILAQKMTEAEVEEAL